MRIQIDDKFMLGDIEELQEEFKVVEHRCLSEYEIYSLKSIITDLNIDFDAIILLKELSNDVNGRISEC